MSNTKKQITLVATVAALLVATSYYLLIIYPEVLWDNIGHCSMISYPKCAYLNVFETAFLVIGLPSISLFISSVSLVFFKDETYVAWRKWAIYGFPIILLLILLAPAHPPGGFITLGYDREIASFAFSILFLAISWVLMGYKVLFHRS